MDLSVQFPWPIGTNGAEKLGLTSRSCAGRLPTGRPASRVSCPGMAAEVQDNNPRGLGDLCRHGRARTPVSQGLPARVLADQMLLEECAGGAGASGVSAWSPESSPRLELCGCRWLHLPCTLSRGGGSRRQLAPGLQSRESGRAGEGSCARGSISVCPCACGLAATGSSEPKTVVVVKAKPSGAAHHPGPGRLGAIDGRIWLFDVACWYKRNN